MYNDTNSLETKNTITTSSLPSLHSLRDADSPVFIKGIKLHGFYPHHVHLVQHGMGIALFLHWEQR